MSYHTILLDTKENVAVLTLNRPEAMNAITAQMTDELTSALDIVSSSDDMRVLVLTGAGRGFCSGADVGGVAAGAGGAIEGPEGARQALLSQTLKIVPKIQSMQKPTIAMVNGVAAGAGCDLTLACDIRIGSKYSRFINSFVKIGLFPGYGGTWLYPRVMPLGKAFEYLYTGNTIEAAEAEKIGVLNRLVPPEELEKETMSLARQIASGPPIAIRLMKLQVYKGLEMDLETALQMAAACEAITITSADLKEGVTAFREKRPPKFRGK